MKRVILSIAIVLLLARPVAAMEFTAPSVPESGQTYLRQQPETFAQGLWQVITEATAAINPALAEAAEVCARLVAVAMLCALARSTPGATETVIRLVCTLLIALSLFEASNSLIALGVDTVKELSDYGKLLIPVLTTALAAQGAATTSVALYAGTMTMNSLLSGGVVSIAVPMLYAFLCVATANCAIGADALEKIKKFLKWIITWTLKLSLYIFTGVIGVTGVVSGTADAAAIKATKLTISGVVPVVGSILADASETILISAGVMKNAVGIYGMLALLAVWIGPFIKIGAQYLLLKATHAVCGMFGGKQEIALVADFAAAMGMLLAMTGIVCLLLLVSTFCLMKGVG